MRLQVPREQLLIPLQLVIGVVERRQTLVILGHLLLEAEQDSLTISATDMEVELVARQSLTVQQPGRVTLPARKLLDIVRSLPEGAVVDLAVDGERAVIRCGRGRFTLATLPAEEFPQLEEIDFDSEFEMGQGQLRALLEGTHFAMAQQDVRYYLNGLFLETDGSRITTVATDGHRLALCEASVLPEDTGAGKAIIPRKGVQELLRLLGNDDQLLRVQVGSNHLRVANPNIRLTTRLIDGRFPDYHRVIPTEASDPLIVDRQLLRQALTRTAILSNEKYRGVRLRTGVGSLELLTHNPENEEAEEQLEVDYQGSELEVGFNVNYLLDALAAIPGEQVRMFLFDANSSCLLRAVDSDHCRYVVMPMRL